MIVNNKHYQIEIDEKNGSIKSFSANGKQFLAKETPLVVLRMLNEKGEANSLISEELSEIKRESDRVYLTFKNLGGENVDCRICVRFSEQDSNTYWYLEVENNSGKLIESAAFPGITVFDDLVDDGGTRKLFSSMMEGVEMRSSRLRSLILPALHTAYPPLGWEGAYPGPSPMQFLAYYDGEDGLYFASHDPDGNYKFVEWYTEDGGIRLLQEVFPQAGKNSFSLTYPVVLGSFKGDWYDAASIYREWVMRAGIIRNPLLKENTELPDWIRESPIVITYPIRGTTESGDMTPNCFYPYTKGLEYIEKYAQIFDSRILTLLMHWEGTAPWAPPFVWPPFGDKENFDKFSEELHENGHMLGLYCSGLGWTQQSGNDLSYNMEQYFEDNGLAECVEVGPTHELMDSTICGWPIRRGYDLCPACEKVKRIAEDEIGKIVGDSNVDYVQFFDQNLGGNTYSCYSDKHGHPPVPGKWMAEEMRDVIKRMKARIHSEKPEKKILIGCETAAAEPFVNDLFFNDLRNNINYLFGVPVPAYSFVFHGYVCNFMGNQTTSSALIDLKKNDTNIFYRYAYAFAQGDILTLVLKKDGKINWGWTSPWNDDLEPDQKALIQYVAQLSAWRKGVLNEALNYGIMEKPLRTKSPLYKEELTVHNYGNRWKYGDYYRTLEGVVTTCYRTEDGKQYQIFVNYQNKEVEVFVQAGKITFVETPDGAEQRELTANKDGEISFIIPARSVRAAVL